ncbi:MAG: hypothetical protein BWX80_00136 [Candidatus Hydrogenedentes bacterium ADurb.Bin101]|jgi:hypothetical protein|nr:MAG: hypothetical protein BWX80_00136 [Candidatus Hydrogenedentes bacterium ADurb.Bin101]HOC68205.1 hypothetical protein [Candidatus Hydrogenedentota bacterium]
MSYDTVKAHLNLNAVLRNLENLCKLDPETASLIHSWDIAVRFTVLGGMSARIGFQNGKCTFQSPAQEPADVVLLFLSDKHLNAMFEERSNPIPLKGFKHLGFLKTEFPKATKRLEYFLKPTPALLEDEAYVHVNTTLSLYTAAWSVCELMRFDPVGRQIGAQMPAGTLQLSVLPEGPHAYIRYDGRGGATAGIGVAKTPSAVLTFESCQTANALFNGKLDGFGAIALGNIKMRGMIPLVENTNVILDRIPVYLQ